MTPLIRQWIALNPMFELLELLKLNVFFAFPSDISVHWCIVEGFVGADGLAAIKINAVNLGNLTWTPRPIG